MSFRNRKALTGAIAAMLIATCLMFVIPESSDVAATPAETVVIESDMDDDMPLSDIVLQYSAISAEKEHQESMGNTVIIRDNNPQRNDPKEQKFIDDMRHVMGLSKDTPNRVTEDSGHHDFDVGPEPLKEITQPTPQPVPVQQNVPSEDIESSDSENEDTSAAEEETVSSETSEEMTNDIITISEFSKIDSDFMQMAIEIACMDGIDLHWFAEKFISYNNKITVAISYSELESADTSSKDDKEETDDETVTIEEDDEGTVSIPDVPEVVQDLFSIIPVAGESVTDTLCSGTDI